MGDFKDKLQAFFTGRKGVIDSFCVSLAFAESSIYTTMALQAVINMLSSAINTCEFQCFEKHKLTKGENYYIFNIEPNEGQNASEFWLDVVANLVLENECLVVQKNDRFYVAEHFEREVVGFGLPVYKNVEINGGRINRTMKDSEVLYLRWHDEKLKDLADKLTGDLGKMIAAANTKFQRENLQKIFVHIPANYPQDEKSQANLRNLIEKHLKSFLQSDSSAALPLTGGITVSPLESGRTSSQGSSNRSRDNRALIDDIFDLVAMTAGIAPVLLKGGVADTKEAFGNTMALCIKPLLKMIETEINRKYFKKEAFLEGTLLKIDTSMLRVTALNEMANALDVLTRIGVTSVNDNRKLLGMEPLKDDWADDHILTKNYEMIGDKQEGSG